jgi:hypothetical protein
MRKSTTITLLFFIVHVKLASIDNPSPEELVNVLDSKAKMKIKLAKDLGQLTQKTINHLIEQVLSDENIEKLIFYIPENQNALPRILEKFKKFLINDVGTKSAFMGPKTIIQKAPIVQIRGEIVKVICTLTAG